MITGNDMYSVMTAMVPLYVAMMLAYASVRWWGIFSPVQCSGINRFVAVFAVPLLSFSFISSNNPYKMDGKFILADTASKIVVFILLSCWAKFSRYGSLDWLITLFSLSTLPNTLVMGIPLLEAMYGEYYGKLMVQVVVLQSIIWYTLLLFLFEYRAARVLLMEQFPETAGSIVSFKVDPDVMSLDGREPLQTQAEVGEDGKIRVLIRRSVSTSQHYELFASPRRSSAINIQDLMFSSPRRSNMMGGSYDIYAPSPARRSNMNHAHTLDLFSMGLTTSMPSSKAITPRPSNLTGAEIYSLTTQSSTPRDITLGFTSTFNEPPFAAAAAAAAAISSGGRALPISAAGLSPRQSNFTNVEMYSLQSSRCPTPRASNFQPGNGGSADPSAGVGGVIGDYSDPPTKNGTTANSSNAPTPPPEPNSGSTDQVHSFVWSSSTSPSVSAAVALPPPETHHSASFHHDPNAMAHDVHDYRKAQNSKLGGRQYDIPSSVTPPPINVGEDFSFGSRAPQLAGGVRGGSSPHNNGNEGTSKQGVHPSTPQQQQGGTSNSNKCGAAERPFGDAPLTTMPSSLVMVKLILQMVGRKLIRNPNTYASLIGVIWSLIAYRYDIAMPAIVLGSLKILSQAGLGMAMFSLGLFMALQPRLIACGTSLAVFAMAIRFLVGPIVMAASSIGVGLRGVHLHAAIVQAALPQGIVPFVFAREYDLHPDILSTAVIFGMLVALPTTILYYVLLGI